MKSSKKIVYLSVIISKIQQGSIRSAGGTSVIMINFIKFYFKDYHLISKPKITHDIIDKINLSVFLNNMMNKINLSIF